MSRVHVLVRQRAVWAVALAVAAVAAPGEGRARTAITTSRLDYAASAGCPTDDDFRAIVVTRLGYDPFRADAADHVSVRVEAVGRTLEGHLEWRDPSGTSIGTQTFPSRTGDCAELARAMGFALALQIQLMAATLDAARPAAPPPPEPSKAEAAPVTAPPAPAARVEREGAGVSGSPPQGPSLLAGGGVLAGVGLSSSPVAVGRLFATAAWPHAALELAAEVTTPSTTTRGDGAGFSQEQFLASLAGCGVRFPWSLCAVAKVGELRVVGQGVDVALTASGLTVQSGIRVAASQSLSDRVYLMAHAEGLARLTQGTVTLDSMPVWTTPRFAALLGMDVALRFR